MQFDLHFLPSAICVAFLGIGCESRRPAPAATQPATGAESAAKATSEKTPPVIAASTLKPEETTPASPGYAVGRVVAADGKPVAVPGARAEVAIVGILEESLLSKTVTADVGADGAYVVALEPGSYARPTGRIEFEFNGQTFRLPLTPFHGPSGRQDSSEGVVQDFVFKLSGPRPGVTADRSNAEHWIGGSIYPRMQGYRPDLGRTVDSPPGGTTVTFTLTPVGSLADGTAGKPIEVKRHYNATQLGLYDAIITDVPLGVWTVRGDEHFPDRGTRPLLFLQEGGQDWKTTVTGTFQADLKESSLVPVTIDFTRQER